MKSNFGAKLSIVKKYKSLGGILKAMGKDINSYQSQAKKKLMGHYRRAWLD